MPQDVRGERLTARVDSSAIEHNVRRIARLVGPAEVMAVVKAQAYGHGLLPSATAALAGGAGWLGVARLGEALELRAGGVTAPLLLILTSPDDDLTAAARHRVDVTVGSPARLVEAARAASTEQPLHIHLEHDSGMGRGGSSGAAWQQLITATAAEERRGRLRCVGVFSHLAAAESDATMVAEQTQRFRRALGEAHAAGLRPRVRHLANSAATFARPDTWFDLVRPGLSVFGISPDAAIGTERELDLRPALSLRCRVATSKRVPAGHAVSYGPDHVTQRETTLAVVPAGYADGIPRLAGNRAEVLVRGRRRPIVGRVCMDQFVVDVGDDGVETGDEVVLFGSGEQGEATLREWAQWCGTIPNEVLARLGGGVRREYV
jgi:alanine racemase